MPPEALEGVGPTPQFDVFALGASLYYFLTGRPILSRVGQSLSPPPSSLMPELPPAVDPVLEKALSDDPGRRYFDASELLAAFRQAIGR